MSAVIVAVVTDLIFSTKISSTGSSLGVVVKTARTRERLGELLAQQKPALVLVDLDLDGVDPIQAIEDCLSAEPRPRILAYVSHVRADLVQAARQAGADEVLARSAFVARLPALLGAAAN